MISTEGNSPTSVLLKTLFSPTSIDISPTLPTSYLRDRYIDIDTRRAPPRKFKTTVKAGTDMRSKSDYPHRLDIKQDLSRYKPRLKSDFQQEEKLK